jgi:ssDNA-binding Zn-finger/Zn-ribbon topoisomerase 1
VSFNTKHEAWSHDRLKDANVCKKAEPQGKTADVEMHETPRMLPPREDMRRHLDEDVQKEIDLGIDKDPQEGVKVGGTEGREEREKEWVDNFGDHAECPVCGTDCYMMFIEGWGPPPKSAKQADDSEIERGLELQEEDFMDQVGDAKREARNAFNNDKYMQQEAKESGLTMDQLWQEYGNDYANEYWQGRQASKTAVKAEEGVAVCPKCNSSLVEEVTDNEGTDVRLMECKDCAHLFSL